jgi:asparagine synthase (glutamine-hydrolysing)
VSTTNNVDPALGHVRLSINDLSPDGAQPFHSPNGKIHAVVNGEFYDYDRIRKEIEDTTGYVFRSRSDSEIVIALYMHHGLNFVHYLRGEFAVVGSARSSHPRAQTLDSSGDEGFLASWLDA